VASLVLLVGRRPWFQWVAGMQLASWALYGYTVDILRPVKLRSPSYWPVLVVPHLLLFLSSQMFYWWLLARIERRQRHACAGLFLTSSVRNLHCQWRRAMKKPFPSARVHRLSPFVQDIGIYTTASSQNLEAPVTRSWASASAAEIDLDQGQGLRPRRRRRR
jgi:hypothetical protein